MFPASPLTHSPVCSQIIAHAKPASFQNLQSLLIFVLAVSAAGGKRQGSPLLPWDNPCPRHRTATSFDFKDSLKGEEKGLSFQQLVSPCIPALPGSRSQWEQTPPPPHMTTPNTRSEDRSCSGNSHTPAEMSSQAHRCSSISPMGNNQKQEGHSL